uniref:Uncharacterized protein n=1 Tax=Arundo donax TaxID=35708 RepID=A0A0A9B8W7_ARUDO
MGSWMSAVAKMRPKRWTGMNERKFCTSSSVS